MPEVKEKWRVARDRLSDWSYRRRRQLLPPQAGLSRAIPRFREVIARTRNSPGSTACTSIWRNALARSDKKAEAIPLFDRVVEEFTTSEHLEKAQKRLQELQAQ